ncbi:MAG: hypothetical protein BGO98_27160 [Myxococcales bacterium 68-20]|nr:hypothetical protein [Myxococcales bacterium]OJY30404.1 MAG: hypothetical protein BGO98_27160 [Myxococcales bacterium 68-20]
MRAMSNLIAVQKVLVAVIALEGAALVVGGCSSSDDAPVSEPDGGSLDEASVADASTPEVAPDAMDSGKRTCSDQNFCHTTLPSAQATLRGVWGDGTVVWSVSEEGEVLRWDGSAWSVHASKLGALYTIWGSGPTDIWIGGERGLHHGTGATSQAVVFEPVASPGDEEIPIRSIWGTSATDVWAVGGEPDMMMEGAGRARVLQLDGGGSSWSLSSVSSEPFAFNHVWADAEGGIWIAGDDGSGYSQSNAVLRRAPGASDFVEVTVSAYNEEDGPVSGAPGTVTGGGLGGDGRIVLSGRTRSGTPSFWSGAPGGDGEIEWSYEARDLNDPNLHSVWALDGATTWVAGDYGRLRSWDGTKWMQAAIMIADFPVIAPLHAIWGTKADDFWVVGRNIALHRKPKEAP